MKLAVARTGRREADHILLSQLVADLRRGLDHVRVGVRDASRSSGRVRQITQRIGVEAERWRRVRRVDADGIDEGLAVSDVIDG
jgi:hypothetical protein